MLEESNLKNRPNYPDADIGDINPQEYEEWFASFEKQLRETIIRLGQVRAGNIGRTWDAGQAYVLLRLLGKAPEFKTREEAYKWAEENICRFMTAEESEKKLLGE